MLSTLASTEAAMTTRPTIRRIGFGELRIAARRGLDDFLATPTQLVFLCILYPVIGLLAGSLAANGEAMHLIFPLAAGFALVGPVAALGLYEISRRRESGHPASWMHAFDVLRAPALGGIVVLSLVLAGLFLLWLQAAHAIHAATLGTLAPGLTLWAGLGTAQGWRMIWIGNLVGLGFAVVVLALSVVSFPLLLDRGGGLGRAIGTSLRAVAMNPVPMAAWGLMVTGLLVLGALPLFIGLAVVLPVLGHATWHLYRLVVAW